jgi:hypothetical protein
LEPTGTFPKLKLVAFAARVPTEAVVSVFVLEFEGFVPAPVSPVQPDSENREKRARRSV